jgi:hypothetical protein
LIDNDDNDDDEEEEEEDDDERTLFETPTTSTSFWRVHTKYSCAT